MTEHTPPVPPPPEAEANAVVAQAALELRLAQLFRHAQLSGEPPHPLQRLIRLYRTAMPGQEPHHG